MSALELNAALFHELNIIVTDETMMEKAIKALRRITASKKEQDETEYIQSSPRMVEIIHEGDREIALGNATPISLEDLWK